MKVDKTSAQNILKDPKTDGLAVANGTADRFRMSCLACVP